MTGISDSSQDNPKDPTLNFCPGCFKVDERTDHVDVLVTETFDGETTTTRMRCHPECVKRLTRRPDECMVCGETVTAENSVDARAQEIDAGFPFPNVFVRVHPECRPRDAAP